MSKIAPAFLDLKSSRAPGVYLNVRESEYHACETPSASRLSNLLMGPGRMWHDSPWNTEREPDDTDAQTAGKALHALILEGPDAFHARYAVQPEPPEGALISGDDLRGECERLGLPKSGTIAAMCERLMGRTDREIWPREIEEFKRRTKEQGQTIISKAVAASIQREFRAAHRQPDVQALWDRPALPEVSVWYVSRSGLPMRARFDLWTPGEIIDLKRIARRTVAPFAAFAARHIAANFLHLQAVIYREAAIAALAMPDDQWHGVPPATIKALKDAGPPDFRWIFIGHPGADILQRILAPEVPIDFARWPDGTPITHERPREPSQLWRSGMSLYDQARARFAHYWRQFGRSQWAEFSPAIGLRDSDAGLGAWALSRETEIEDMAEGE